MAGNISTTISVSYAANGTVQYSPGSQIVVPADTVETVTWQAYKAGTAPLPAFVKDSIHATGNDVGKVQIALPPSLGDPRYVGSFVTTINNAGTGSALNAGVAFSVVDPLAGPNPPMTDGGGSIRNKGTSIWVWQLVLSMASLFVGALIGYTARTYLSGTGPQ
ncbi:MAG TPA: hypothetical protein VH375_09735 [Rhodanobacteraceae bacterium]